MHTGKQESELNAVRLFQGASGLLPGYELAPGSDPPDVVARHGAHLVGIEVRRLFADEGKGGSPQRCQLSLRRSVINRAQELHRATENRWYTVKV